MQIYTHPLSLDLFESISALNLVRVQSSLTTRNIVMHFSKWLVFRCSLG